jgi:glutamine amidotransferase
MIAVLDTGLSNVGSVVNMLHRLGHPSVLASEPQPADEADAIILPGVGHFRMGMERLRETGLDGAIHRAADRGKPVLGICLGLHLLARRSAEGDCAGLGLLPADVVRFDETRMGVQAGGAQLPVPHMGWREVRAVGHAPIMNGWDADSRFYFVHTYHLTTDDPSIGLMEADYGYPFLAAAKRGSVCGVQFHPEKSHVFGKRLLKAFAEQVHA